MSTIERHISGLLPDGAPPLLNAAGTVKTMEECLAALQTPAGAIVAGSYTLEERVGNPGNVYYSTEFGTLNSLGLPGPALRVWTGWVREVTRRSREMGKLVWVSVAGFNPEEYRICSEAALEAGADVIELNLGCPNVWEKGDQKPIVSYSKEQVVHVLDSIKASIGTERPIGVKLSPILDPVVLAQVDGVIRESGIVSFVTAINTVPNAFAIDSGRPAIEFGHHLAGMSGPPIRWIGLGQIVQHRLAVPGVALVGVGGIETGADLEQYLSPMVGAHICQVGTAWWRRGPRVIEKILQEYVDVRPVDQA